MELIVAFLIMVVVAIIVAAMGKSPTQPRPLTLPYQKRKFFFTRAEQRFYNDLTCAVRQLGNLTLFAKVRLADLLLMTQGTTGQNFWRAWGRISQKHADFVVLRPSVGSDIPGSLEPTLIIELDDASHDAPDRQERDHLVDAIYAQVGLPILHIPVAHNYDVGVLAAQIRAAIDLPAPSGTGMPTRRPAN